MAFIEINVENELYSIELDNNEWESLTVNGEQVPNNSGFKWQQNEAGPVKFQATASHISTVNPLDTIILAGSDTSHLAVLTAANEGSQFTMKGLLENVPLLGGKTDKQYFNQGMMMGVFQKVS